jgi:cell filamentation protein
VRELARAAGHSLDFSVVSQERMIQASVAANDHGDKTMMRRLFDDASDPERIAALRDAIASFETYGFSWNKSYVATIEPGHRAELTLIGIGRAGDHFLAHSGPQILIGKTVDLPEPRPEPGQRFVLDPQRDRAETRNAEPAPEPQPDTGRSHGRNGRGRSR